METQYGKALDAIREARNFRWEGMAIVLGYSANRLSKIVNGRREIPPGMTDKMIKRFRSIHQALTNQEIEALKKGEEATRAKEIDERTNRKK